MKKIFLLPFFFFFVTAAQACDICGCGVGNNYIGILPDFQKHIVGLRYRSNSMLTHIGAGGTSTYLTAKEIYRTMEAWSGWNLGSNFRLMAAVPYSFNEKQNATGKSNKSGLGDITLSGYYQFLNNRQNLNSNLLIQSLWLGGGIKLKTGAYNPADKSSSNSNVNLFQLGTGSTDFILSGMYDIRLQDAGINVSSHYKINTANKFDYRYGNKFSLNAQAYYKLRINNKLMIAPNTGVQVERSQTDIDKDISVSASGGNLAMATAGVEIAFAKIAIGANMQIPLAQNLANGIAQAKKRVMVHVSIAL